MCRNTQDTQVRIVENLLTVIPLPSPGPHVGSQVPFAFQKSRAAVADPQSTQGLPPTESLY